MKLERASWSPVELPRTEEVRSTAHQTIAAGRKMKKNYPMAMVTAPGKIEFRQRRVPSLGAHDVLVKVRAASICGSDLHVYKGNHPAAPLPTAIGHELSGEVLKVGEEVSRVQIGEGVAIEPVVVCGACEFCQRGQYHLCQQISFQYREGQGAFAPYYVAHENWVHRLPASLSFQEGALLEPLSVAVHAVSKCGLRVGHTGAVFGDGPIGLLILSLVKLAGGGRTFIVGAREHRLQKATELGAFRAIDHRAGDAVQAILEDTSRLGVDVAFEAVGSEKSLVQSLRALKKGGKAVVVGIFEEDETSVPANLFVQKEITLTGSQAYCWDFQTALTLLDQQDFSLKTLITHVVPLASLQEAFELAMDPRSKAIKVVVKVE